MVQPSLNGGKVPAAPPDRGAPATNRLIVAVLLGAILLGGGWLRLGGVDFGQYHWDEGIYFGTIQDAVRRGSLLPGRYNYPSVSFYVQLGATMGYYRYLAATGAVEDLAHFLHPDPALRERILVFQRGVSAILSSLCVIAAFLIVRIGFRSDLGGLAAAAVMAFGRDVIVHSRWVAPDMLGVLLVGLMLAALARFENRPRLRTACLAGLLAGLAVATKYNLAVFAAAVPVAGVMWSRGRRERLTAGLVCGAVIVATFLMTTPGAWLDRQKFRDDVAFEMEHYGHRGDTHAPSSNREPGLDHLASIGRYLLLHSTAGPAWLGVLVAGLAAIGAAAGVGRRRRFALLLLMSLIVYAALMSGNRVFRARNYQVLVLGMAVLAGVGLDFVVAKLRREQVWVQGAGLVLGLVIGGFLVAYPYADMRGIVLHKDDDTYYASRCLDWLRANVGPDEPVLILREPTLDAAFAPLGSKLPANVRPGAVLVPWSNTRPDGTSGPGEDLLFVDVGNPAYVVFENPSVVFLGPDGRPIVQRIITHLNYRPGDFLAWFGTHEVDYDIYPRWLKKKLVVMRAQRYVKLLAEALRYDPHTGTRHALPLRQWLEGRADGQDTDRRR